VTLKRKAKEKDTGAWQNQSFRARQKNVRKFVTVPSHKARAGFLSRLL
jgi:hypothetical protein